MKPARLLELVQPITISGEITEEINHVTSDSRKVQKGSCYVAIKGYTVDGHEFIDAAKNAGAKIIIGEKSISPDGYYYLKVKDSRKVLAPLVFETHGNPQQKMRFIGVTGTNGKTTVSTLVYQSLTKLGFKTGLMGTIKTIIGLHEKTSTHTTGNPEYLAETFSEMVEEGVSVCVMEVSSHALDQRRTEGISFDVAIFTNLSHDHLDYHQTESAYLNAKKLLFDGLSDNAIAIINTDDKAASDIISDCKATIWEYGFKNSESQVVSNTSDGLVLQIDETTISTPLSGLFNAYNVSAAWLACKAVGCSSQNVATVLAEVTGAEGRLQKITSEFGSTIFVDYAHTPDALKNVTSTLAEVKGKGSLITVFGCGGDRDRSKRPVMASIACEYSDYVVITSDNPRTENPASIIDEIVKGIPSGFTSFKQIEDRREAIQYAISLAKPEDIVLIAGKGHETYQEVNGVRHHFDDVEEVQSALNLLKKGSA